MNFRYIPYGEGIYISVRYGIAGSYGVDTCSCFFSRQICIPTADVWEFLWLHSHTKILRLGKFQWRKCGICSAHSCTSLVGMSVWARTRSKIPSYQCTLMSLQHTDARWRTSLHMLWTIARMVQLSLSTNCVPDTFLSAKLITVKSQTSLI